MRTAVLLFVVAASLQAADLQRAIDLSKSGQNAEAERQLRAVISEAPGSAAASEAHGQLAYQYARQGRNKAAYRELLEMRRIKPDTDGVKGALALFGGFARHPDLSVERLRPSRIAAEYAVAGVTLPVAIGVHRVRWGVDTGANLSLISEGEARRLGLRVVDADATVPDMQGGKTDVRTAVVPQMIVGDIHLKNVAMLVVPDMQPPMNSVPAGQQGILGLPVLVAFGGFRLNREGSFEAGIAPISGKPNLRFEGLDPVLTADSADGPLRFVFDSGNGSGTQLWTAFAEDYPERFAAGRRTTNKVEQIGGVRHHEVIEIPAYSFTIGGFEASLRPARLFPKGVGKPGLHGLLGLDVMRQARRMTVDFRTMVVKFE